MSHPLQRAIAQRFSALALSGHVAMSDLSPECEPKRTSADADLGRFASARRTALARCRTSRRTRRPAAPSQCRAWARALSFRALEKLSAQQPVERDIAKEAALRRLGPSL